MVLKTKDHCFQADGYVIHAWSSKQNITSSLNEIVGHITGTPFKSEMVYTGAEYAEGTWIRTPLGIFSASNAEGQSPNKRPPLTIWGETYFSAKMAFEIEVPPSWVRTSKKGCVGHPAPGGTIPNPGPNAHHVAEEIRGSV